MVAPALDDIADEYDIVSSTERLLVMSIFLLAYAGLLSSGPPGRLTLMEFPVKLALSCGALFPKFLAV